MKVIYSLLVLLLYTSLSAIGQTNAIVDKNMPKDSLPNLLIVTIDCSGSMRDMDYGNIPNKYDSIATVCLIDKYHDKVLLLKSGISKTELWSTDIDSVGRHQITYYEGAFDSLLVKRLSGLLTYDQSLKQINSICSNKWNFTYNWSFTSIVRPLSINVIKNNKNVDFSKFNNIYHFLITDDGDPNDQWSNDFKHLKKYHKSFEEVNRILPLIASSDFDFITQKTGKFIEIASDENQPRVYLTKYETFEENHPEKILNADSLLTIGEFHDDRFTLNPKKCSSTNVDFVYIDSYTLNGHEVDVKKYIYSQEYLLSSIHKSEILWHNNKISVKGYYQETYNDRVLGKRHRKVDFSGELSIHPTAIETIACEKKCFYAVLIMIGIVLIFIIVRRNIYVLNIYVAGVRYSVRKKAMNKLRYDDYNLMDVICNDNNGIKTYYYKSSGINVVNVNLTDQFTKELYIAIFGNFTNYNSYLTHEELGLKDVWKSKNYRFLALALMGYSVHKFEFEDCTDNEKIEFEYSQKSSHKLILGFDNNHHVKQVFGTNYLQEINLRMLASYYEDNAYKFNSTQNNVLVNIFYPGDTSKYKYMYAVLNIYDTNSRQSADRVFLRYSLMCFFNDNQLDFKTITSELIGIARYVLKCEKQKIGYIEKKANFMYNSRESDITVDVSPMLSYLYLRTKSHSRMIYSPFKDGKIDLTNKQVELYPKRQMELVNYPVFSKNIVYLSRSVVKFNARSQRMEALKFDGNDIVRFFDDKIDYSYGHPEQCFDGITYYSVNANELNELINNK